MAKETKVKRIKAKDKVKKPEVKETKTAKKPAQKPKISKYAAKVAGVEIKEKKTRKVPKFLRVIGKPFVFLLAPILRYFGDSWKELQLVRWPTRRETWKMTFAVIVFSVAFAVLILVLDGLFNWVFKLIIK